MSADPHTPRSIRWDGSVNITTMLALVTMIAAGGAGYMGMESRLSVQERRLEERVVAATSREADQEARLRQVELQQIRDDEKFNAILEAIVRVERRLEASQP